jgi:hypothetical protein
MVIYYNHMSCFHVSPVVMKAGIAQLLLMLPLICMFSGCGKEETEEPEYFGSGYFVAPDGDDANPGTISQPWATWEKAFRTAMPGDTVYFRGGVYTLKESIYLNSNRSKNGTGNYPIYYFNFPGETPILDGDDYHPDRFNTGIELQEREYLHFRGMTIRNLHQFDSSIEAVGFTVHTSKHIVLENITVYNIGGVGIKVYLGDDIHLINCDVYDCADTYNPTTARPGGKADGFGLYNLEVPGTTYYLSGCRAWNCSDDGFNTNSQGMVYFDSCWSFNNGRYEGDGNGFKYGGLINVTSGQTRSFKNCIAAGNWFAGFNENQNYRYNMNLVAYNNTTYANQVGFQNFKFYVGELEDNVYTNNLSYKDTTTTAFLGTAKDEYNSWQADSLHITDEDFLSLDISEMMRSRKPDGSLPEVDFMKLAPGSDLIDAGVDVGLPYKGSAPDLGYDER